MPGEIITLSVGQCGNQVGQQYWELLMKEHGIDPLTRKLTESAQALVQSPARPVENKSTHFYPDDVGNYVPRAVLVDMEPRVVNSVQAKLNHVFNPESIHVEASGGGAGNNWAVGHQLADALGETLHSMLQREAEACDQLEAFQLLHSISGGTGSGVGSWFLEVIADQFPKALSLAYSVVPNSDPNNPADVTVGPYNAVLSLKRLAEEADACIVIDNAALNRIATEKLHLPSITVSESNGLVAQAIAGLSQAVRFPQTTMNSVSSILSHLVPMPRQQFLCTSLSPVENVIGVPPTEAAHPGRVVRRTTPFDVMRKLHDPSHCLASVPFDQPNAKFISCLNFIKGDIPHADLWEATLKINEGLLPPYTSTGRSAGLGRNKKCLTFVPWVPNSIKVERVHRSPFYTSMHKVSGTMIGNTTAIATVFDGILSSHDRLINRHAFIEPYRQALGSLDEFHESSAIVETLSADYKAANQTDYMRFMFGSTAPRDPSEGLSTEGGSFAENHY